MDFFTYLDIPRRSARLLSSLAVLALAPLACSGDDSGTSDTVTTTATATSTSTATASTSSTSSSSATSTSTTGDGSTSTATESESATSDPGTGTTEGTTGNDSGASDCVEESTPLENDQASPLGFSAAEALEGLTGVRNGTLTWVDEMIISDAYRGTELPIVLAILGTPNGVNYVEATDSGDIPDPSCVSRLEISLDLALSSDGGEFAEGRDAVVSATKVGEVELARLQLVPLGLAGSLDLDAVMGLDLTLDTLDIYATFGADQATGSLNGEASDPMLGSIGYGVLATLEVGAPQ